MNRATGRKRKKLIALRFKDETISLLKRLCKRANKTQARIIEEALFCHAKELV